MSLPFVSIIVVNYNLKAFLRQLIESLVQTRYPSFEIVFVDNASTDQSVEYVRNNFQDKRLRIVEFELNLGLYRAQNLAAQHAKGEYLCFLDADVRVCMDWLSPLVDAMVKDDSVGATQPFVSEMDASGVVIADKSIETEEVTDVQEISFPRGVCTLVKNEVFKRVRGFDEDFFYRYGDVDFGWRIWLYGYRCLQVSAAKIYHAGKRKSSDREKRARDARQRPFLFHDLKNIFVMQLKFGEASTLLRMMLFYLLGDSLIIAANFRDRSVAHWKALFKAVFWVIRNMKLTMRKRALLQHERLISDAAMKKRFPTGLFIYFWSPGVIITN